MQTIKSPILNSSVVLGILFTLGIAVEQSRCDAGLSEAIDSTFALLSGGGTPSNNSFCVQNMKELMIRNSIQPSADHLRTNLSDAQLLRLGILASIALISPWNQNLEGKLIMSDRGILIEDYHPSSSESDIMLCVVCTLLGIILLFHGTAAQYRYVISDAPSK